jgi:hypothetical protein
VMIAPQAARHAVPEKSVSRTGNSAMLAVATLA